MNRKVMVAVVAVLVLFAATPVMAQMPDWSKAIVVYFPHFAVGGGIEYMTEASRIKDGYDFGVILQNNSSQSTQVRLTWWGSDGERFSLRHEPSSSDTFQSAYGLMPLASLQTVYSLPAAQVKTGWIKAEVLPTSSGQVSATVFLTFRYRVNGDVVGQATVSASTPGRSFSLYARRYGSPSSDRSETGVAIANPNDRPAQITITRRGLNGEEVDTVPLLIPAMGQIARFVSELKKLPSMDYEGSLDIFSDVPIVVMGLQTTGDAASFNFSSITVGPGRPTP